MDKRWVWPFELEEQIGEGGMGEVYKARYVGNNRRVAVKILPARLASNATVAARFTREMEVLKDLRHPNIVHCFGGTTEGKQLFYAMELVDGGTVESVLHEKQKLRWEQVIDYGVQVCKALAHAHASGVIHRDIKPGNLLLTKSGTLKLADFGLALVTEGDRITATGKTLGTYLYMSPEQIRGKPPATGQSDLYALGCVLFELLTGAPPFPGSGPAEILNKHLHEPPPHPAAQVVDCPQPLDELVVQLLQKDAAARPANAQEVIDRLTQIDTVVVIQRKRTTAAGMPSPGVGSSGSGKVSVAPAPDAVPVKFRAAGWGIDPVLLMAGCALLLGLGWWAGEQWNVGSGPAGAKLWQSAVRDPVSAVRIAAARSLGQLAPASPPSLAALEGALVDTDPQVRAAVVTALGDAGACAKNLIPALARLERGDESPDVRFAASRAVQALNSATPSSLAWGIWALRLLLALALCWGMWRQWRGTSKISTAPVPGKSSSQ